MPPRYLKLAALYFFYFASLGIYLPYWAPYLQTLGLGAVEIGELLAVALATKLFAPYIWGWIADHTARRMRMMRIATTLMIVFYALLLVRNDYAWLFAGLLLFSFFWNALLPQLESVTMDSLGHVPHHYGKIRLWGSVGFVVCALGCAPVIVHFGMVIVPYLIFGVLVMMWIVSLRSVDRRIPRSAPTAILRKLLRPEVLCLLLLCFVMQLTHSPYYGFFSIYMHDHGYGATLIGLLWALGVIAEIIIFILLPRLLPIWGAPALLGFSMLVTALRWVLISQFPGHLPVIVFAQLLHAVTFGVYHTAAIHLIDEWFPGNLHGRGQAVYSAVSFGFGGALGSLLTGHMWDSLGGSRVFLLMGVTALLGALLALPLYRGQTRY